MKKSRFSMKIKASFDDGTTEDVKAAALMRQFDIPTIFYWPVNFHMTNEHNGRTSLSDTEQDDIAENFEIGSHTVSHPLLTRIPIETAREEISFSREILQKRFGQEINSFCYPRGYSNPVIQDMVVEAGYTNARSTLVGYVFQSENPYFEQTALHIACNRREYAGLDWMDYGVKLLEIARNVPDGVFHIWGHSWEIEKNGQWERLEKFLKFMKAVTNG
jgi:peptidoglycan-N-acetylglucosamine deacetylase